MPVMLDGCHTTEHAVQADDWVLLYLDDERTYLLRIRAGAKFSTHQGIIQFDEVIGRSYGETVACGEHQVLILEPTLEDRMMKVKRRTNINYPKDAALVLMKLNLGPSARVLEVGCGSGSMTTALASSVIPNGQVHTYDLREEFLELAQENLSRYSHLEAAVEWHVRDPERPFEGGPFDAAVLDIATPWDELDAVVAALRPGARIATLNPTYNQIERTALAMQEIGLVMIDSMEIWVRHILPRQGRVRPVQRMVGHTEFLLFAVRPAQLSGRSVHDCTTLSLSDSGPQAFTNPS